VYFGVPFIANPDLVERFKYNLPLSESNRDTYYTGGEIGYADYPASGIAASGTPPEY
jgi:N-ethylmaleimide reductase